MSQIGATELWSVLLDGVGHYVAMEASDELAQAIRELVESINAY